MQFVFLQFTLGSDLYFTSYSDDDKKASRGSYIINYMLIILKVMSVIGDLG